MVYFSLQEVYWHDSTCSMDQMDSVRPECVPGMASRPLRKILSIFYQNHHDFLWTSVEWMKLLLFVATFRSCSFISSGGKKGTLSLICITLCLGKLIPT